MRKASSSMREPLRTIASGIVTAAGFAVLLIGVDLLIGLLR